jgi:hypothetical protein
VITAGAETMYPEIQAKIAAGRAKTAPGEKR